MDKKEGKRRSKGHKDNVSKQKSLDHFFRPKPAVAKPQLKLVSASPQRKKTKSTASAGVQEISKAVNLKFTKSPKKSRRRSLYSTKQNDEVRCLDDAIDCTATQQTIDPLQSPIDDDIIDCTPDAVEDRLLHGKKATSSMSASTAVADNHTAALAVADDDIADVSMPGHSDIAHQDLPGSIHEGVPHSQDSILDIAEAIEADIVAPPSLTSENSLVKRITSQMTVTPSPKKSSSKQAVVAPVKVQSQALQRLVVNSMQACEVNGMPSLRLATEHVRSSKRIHVTLQQDWLQTPVSQGSIIEIVPFDIQEDSDITVSNDGLRLLIFEPDRLLTSTRIAGSFECPRKAVLADRFKSLDVTTDLMVWGTMLHEVFQSCLSQRDFTASNIRLVMEEVIANHVATLYGVDKTENEAREHMLQYVDMLHGWGSSFVRDEPNATVNLDPFNQQVHHDTMSIVGLADIEENCWVPRLGMKGMIDATVTIKLKRDRLSQMRNWRDGDAASSGDVELRTVPFELKTGRHVQGGHPEHRAQVILYALMMADQGTKVEAGLLHYLKSGDTYGVAIEPGEVRALVLARNELALYAARPDSFPDMLGDRRACSRCFSLDLCTMIHASCENGSRDTSALDDEFDARSEHLNEHHKSYFANMLRALNLEASVDGDNLPAELWQRDSDELEQTGFTVCQLIIASGGHRLNTRQRHCYEYVFQRVDNPDQVSPHAIHLAEGDAIVLSSQALRVRYAVATGVIGSIEVGSLTCYFEQPLRSHVAEPESPAPTQAWLSAAPINHAVYRVDKARYASNVRSQLSAVADLFVSGKPVVRSKTAMQAAEHSQGDASASLRNRRRELIVDLKAPKFAPQLGMATQQLNALPLNDGQKAAVAHVLKASDYALIQGMPGTGKTTVISQLVRILVASGRRVLLSAFTHSAVDNIMLKLRDFDIKMLRLGRSHSVHPNMAPYLLDELQDQCSSVHDMHQLYVSAMVVGTTCLGANHMLLSKQRFDYCIVDEASQITQAVSLQPIHHADRFVLVGDHKQLPPLVRSEQARELGMGISLFKRLSDAHPSALVKLSAQYRMNDAIMDLANKLFYRGLLTCGSDQVAQSRLSVPFRDTLVDMATLPSWIQAAINPNQSVLFMDTHAMEGKESKAGKRIQNESEAHLVVSWTRLFVALGMKEEDIGVICPYRAQLSMIQSMLDSHGYKQVEVNTVDRYQGRDKQLILVSFVRDNPDGVVGDLLKDWRRINVAITRAKHKLLLCGAKETLRHNEICAKLMARCEESQAYVELKHDARQTLDDVIEQVSCTALFQDMEDDFDD
eukprot:TRINITY_DN8742_c0_g1_i3.p1 TRINITY_DN8742_c0_g1~~TRINITY_DN8742_c0_g1_i3.p1  ORF type:complete len:1308 (+),score=258.03 TRINITY_DN8742_c0_g1_i3:39-3962(+)